MNSQYPYERAEKFNKDIRKLGISEDGHSYLDQVCCVFVHQEYELYTFLSMLHEDMLRRRSFECYLQKLVMQWATFE